MFLDVIQYNHQARRLRQPSLFCHTTISIGNGHSSSPSPSSYHHYWVAYEIPVVPQVHVTLCWGKASLVTPLASQAAAVFQAEEDGFGKAPSTFFALISVLSSLIVDSL